MIKNYYDISNENVEMFMKQPVNNETENIKQWQSGCWNEIVVVGVK